MSCHFWIVLNERLMDMLMQDLYALHEMSLNSVFASEGKK